MLGDTRTRHELLVFAQANQARLPLAIWFSLTFQYAEWQMTGKCNSQMRLSEF